MMSDFLALPEVRAGYSDYMSMLNERGVTAIKEMAFDDYYGFADEMARREESGELTVRVSMMSQPVGAGANLAYAREARERFRGPFVRFSGFNRMTDRGVWAGLAEMIEPYEDSADAGAAGKTVVEEPEWDRLRTSCVQLMLTDSDIPCIARAMAPFVAPWRSMPRCLETSMDGCFAAMRLPISRTLTRPILSSLAS